MNKSKKVKTYPSVFDSIFLTHPQQCDAIKEHLEAMALQGWKLKKVFRYTYYFDKIEPAKLSYAVDVFKDKSLFNTSPSSDAVDYIDFCKDAGWEHICTNKYISYFVSTNENMMPITTDQEAKFRNINRASRNQQLFILFFIIATLRSWFNFVPTSVNGYILLSVIFSLLFLLAIPKALNYYLWYFKQKKNLKQRLPIQCISLPNLKKQISFDLLVICFVGLAAFASAISQFLLHDSFKLFSPLGGSTFMVIWGLLMVPFEIKNPDHDNHVLYYIFTFFITFIIYIILIQLFMVD